jgi:serine/threonine protein kinase, bacterial
MMMPMWPLVQRHRRAAIALAASAAFVLIVVVIKAIAGHGSSQQSAQVELPFTGLNQPYAVAVDSAGDVYVTDWGNNRVLKLPGG